MANQREVYDNLARGNFHQQTLERFIGGRPVDSLHQDGHTLFLSACKGGNVQAIKYLLNLNADINYCHDGNELLVPLVHACRSGEIAAVEFLLKQPGIVVNRGTVTPLYVACVGGSKGLIELLLKHPETDPNKICTQQVRDFEPNYVTPLYAVCRNGLVSLAELLIEYGAEVDIPNTSPSAYEAAKAFARNTGDDRIVDVLERGRLKSKVKSARTNQ